MSVTLVTSDSKVRKAEVVVYPASTEMRGVLRHLDEGGVAVAYCQNDEELFRAHTFAIVERLQDHRIVCLIRDAGVEFALVSGDAESKLFKSLISQPLMTRAGFPYAIACGISDARDVLVVNGDCMDKLLLAIYVGNGTKVQLFETDSEKIELIRQNLKRIFNDFLS